MTYPTLIDIAYWTLLGLIIFGVWLVAGLALSLAWLRAIRHRQVVLARKRRWRSIQTERQGRALEDACWYLLRPSEAALAETIADAKAVVRLVRENRRTSLALVHDEAL